MLSPGATFAGYRIEGLIGEGGMGAVYLARHPRLPREDALKVLHPALSREPSYVVRFEREADAAARLSHPAVVAVYDRGMYDGQLWISMQYVRGGDAAMDLRAHGPMALPRAVHIVSQVADALDHAHAHGLVHRDVKPDNILLSPSDTGPGERVMLTDFGIASAQGTTQLTGTGSFVATMAYAPLEQLEGRGVDARTDVYALGAVLYELLTAERPFAGLGVEALYAAKLRGDVPDLAVHRRDVPEPVAGVVRRAMAAEPGLRFASCGELAAALRRAAAPPPPPPLPPGMPTVTGPTRAPTPSPAPAWEQPSRPRRRRRLLVALGALVVLLLAGGVTGVLLLTGGPDRPDGLRLDTAEGEVRLHWSPVRGADTYELSRDGAHLADTAGTGYVDADVEGGRSYRYEVRAVDGDSRSEPAAFPAVTAPLAPPQVTAAVDGLSVVLTWAAVPGAEHYEIASGGQTLASVPGTTWTHEGAGAGRHAYVVTAVDEDGGGRSSGRVAADVEPWGTMQPIATRLPTLFPPTPADSLPEPVARHTCAAATPDNGAVERVVCTFDNGIQTTVDRWATAQGVTDDLQTFNAATTAITVWNCTEGGDTEGQFVESVLSDGSPYELLTFVDEEVALFDVYVGWNSTHTVEDLHATFYDSGIFCP